MTRTIQNISRILIMLIMLSVSLSAVAAEPDSLAPVVNINDASEMELAYLPGVGPSTAAHIVQYRKQQPFRKPMHLMRVKGIGRKTFAKLKPYIVIEGPTTATEKIKLQTP